MEDVNKIYENYGKRKKEYNKEEYAEFKKKEKNDVYKLIEKSAERIVQDKQSFKKYLDTQAKFGQYSVGNTLLILAQMPEATILKDYENWISIGGFPKKFRKNIKILEPGNSYMKEDGSTRINYNVKYVCDISQVNIKQKPRTIKYDNKLLLKVFLSCNQANLEIVDEIANSNRSALYNQEQDILYIVRGSEPPSIFYELTQELAKQELGEDTTIGAFKNTCVSYMLCKKYGIDVADYNIGELPFEFKEMEAKEIREELEPIRKALENIDTRANYYIETILKENREKSKSR